MGIVDVLDAIIARDPKMRLDFGQKPLLGHLALHDRFEHQVAGRHRGQIARDNDPAGHCGGAG